MFGNEFQEIPVNERVCAMAPVGGVRKKAQTQHPSASCTLLSSRCKRLMYLAQLSVPREPQLFARHERKKSSHNSSLTTARIGPTPRAQTPRQLSFLRPSLRRFPSLSPCQQSFHLGGPGGPGGPMGRGPGGPCGPGGPGIVTSVRGW